MIEANVVLIILRHAVCIRGIHMRGSECKTQNADCIRILTGHLRGVGCYDVYRVAADTRRLGGAACQKWRSNTTADRVCTTGSSAFVTYT